MRRHNSRRRSRMSRRRWEQLASIVPLNKQINDLVPSGADTKALTSLRRRVNHHGVLLMDLHIKQLKAKQAQLGCPTSS